LGDQKTALKFQIKSINFKERLNKQKNLDYLLSLKIKAEL